MNKIEIHRTTKKYKTVKNLERALSNFNLPQAIRYIECWTEDGHVTAVFVLTGDQKIYAESIARNGFKVVG